jgi:hypothetical protein
MERTSSQSLALAVTMNCELKLGLDWSRSSMVPGVKDRISGSSVCEASMGPNWV